MIEVCDYSPIWKAQFIELKSKIWPVVSKYSLSIEHIGSTSVEGLAAKPIIDIDIVIEDRAALPDVVRELSILGYRHIGNLDIEGREAFKQNHDDINHNLYVCMKDSLALKNHIVLRNHLRNNATDCAKYGVLKKKLAKEYPNNIDAYVEGKSEFILSILGQYEFASHELNSILSVNKR